MKKLFLMLVMSAFILPLAAENNIKMVTYFPVPYVNYNDLEVTDTLDIGLKAGQTGFLNAAGKQITVGGNMIMPTGRLSLLSGNIAANDLLSVGSTSLADGMGELQFNHNLTINSQANTYTSVEATDTANLGAGKLFLNNKQFPACNNGTRNMSWQVVTMNGVSRVYLACGTVPSSPGGNDPGEEEEEQGGNEASDCSDPDYFNANKAECCLAENNYSNANCWTTSWSCIYSTGGDCWGNGCGEPHHCEAPCELGQGCDEVEVDQDETTGSGVVNVLSCTCVAAKNGWN